MADRNTGMKSRRKTLSRNGGRLFPPSIIAKIGGLPAAVRSYLAAACFCAVFNTRTGGPQTSSLSRGSLRSVFSGRGAGRSSGRGACRAAARIAAWVLLLCLLPVRLEMSAFAAGGAKASSFTDGGSTYVIVTTKEQEDVSGEEGSSSDGEAPVSGEDPDRKGENGSSGGADADAGSEEEGPAVDMAPYLTSAKLADEGTSLSWPARVRKERDYGLFLEFGESGELQFPEDGSRMVYTLPEGLSLGSWPFVQYFNVELQEGRELTNNRLAYDPEMGTVSMSWNREDEFGFSLLCKSSAASFTIGLKARFDLSTEEIAFSPTVSGRVIENLSRDIDIVKSGTYDRDTGLVSFVAKLTSYGGAEEIDVWDTMEGEALSYLDDPGVVWSDPGNSSIRTASPLTEFPNKKGFNLHIDRMEDGQIITLVYSAKMKRSKLTADGAREQTLSTISLLSEATGLHTRALVFDDAFSGSSEGVDADASKEDASSQSFGEGLKSVTVKTRWQDLDGNPALDKTADDAVTFDLYRTTGDIVSIMAAGEDPGTGADASSGKDRDAGDPADDTISGKTAGRTGTSEKTENAGSTGSTSGSEKSDQDKSKKDESEGGSAASAPPSQDEARNPEDKKDKDGTTKTSGAAGQDGRNSGADESADLVSDPLPRRILEKYISGNQKTIELCQEDLALDPSGDWTLRLSLPEKDADGNPYTYFALERTPAGCEDFYLFGGSDEDTLTEDGAAGKSVEERRSMKDSSTVESSEGEEKGSVDYITILNREVAPPDADDLGSLSVTIRTKGLSSSEEADREYLFEIRNGSRYLVPEKDGYVLKPLSQIDGGRLISTASVAAFSIKSGETMVFEGLLPAVYTVEEVGKDDAQVSGYTMKTAGEGPVTVYEKHIRKEPSSVKITNSYVPVNMQKDEEQDEKHDKERDEKQDEAQEEKQDKEQGGNQEKEQAGKQETEQAEKQDKDLPKDTKETRTQVTFGKIWVSDDDMPAAWPEGESIRVELRRRAVTDIGESADGRDGETDAAQTPGSETDAAETDEAEPDAAETDGNGTDAAETDEPGTDSVETDAVKAKAAETDAEETDAAKAENSTETDAEKAVASETDAEKTNTAEADAEEKNPEKAEDGHSDDKHSDDSRSDDVNADGLHSDDVLSDDSRSDDVRSDDSHSDDVLSDVEMGTDSKNREGTDSVRAASVDPDFLLVLDIDAEGASLDPEASILPGEEQLGDISAEMPEEDGDLPFQVYRYTVSGLSQLIPNGGEDAGRWEYYAIEEASGDAAVYGSLSGDSVSVSAGREEAVCIPDTEKGAPSVQETEYIINRISDEKGADGAKSVDADEKAGESLSGKKADASETDKDVPETKDFTFYTIWLRSGSSVPYEWMTDSIEVALSPVFEDRGGSGSVVSGDAVTMSISADGGDGGDGGYDYSVEALPDSTWRFGTGVIYKVTIRGLEKAVPTSLLPEGSSGGEWEYRLTETAPHGFTARYYESQSIEESGIHFEGQKSEDQEYSDRESERSVISYNNAEYVDDGGAVENSMSLINLPGVGGPGTMPLYFAGLIAVALAGIGLLLSGGKTG